jgi:hypothetical protein
MTEVLFSEQATHYVLPGRTTQETLTYSVSPSEVTVFSKVILPGVAVDSNILIQATKMGEDVGTFQLSPRFTNTGEEPVDVKSLFVDFIDYIADCTETVQSYAHNQAKDDKDPKLSVLQYVLTGLGEARTKVLDS